MYVSGKSLDAGTIIELRLPFLLSFTLLHTSIGKTIRTTHPINPIPNSINHVQQQGIFHLPHIPRHLFPLHQLNLSIPIQSRPSFSNQMIRQQKVRNPLLDPILMAAVRTHQTALADLRLQEKRVQLLHHLRVVFELLWRWWGRGKSREA